MCGIAGVFKFSNDLVEKKELKIMADTLRHRGPDGEGFWVNPKKKIGLAHRRLSILDLSEAGKQPMRYKERYTITFNGELYNYIEIRELLSKKGYRFFSETDTEVILAAYDFFGENCLKKFDGMFAFAIWDEKKQELFCARDRFGEKPFFFFHSKSQFVFASEAKSIFSTGIKKKPNRKKIFEYLLFLNTENPLNKNESFFEGIYQIEPATYLIINSDGFITKNQYWDIDITTTNYQSEKINIEKFNDLFVSSVSRRLRSDVKVGSSLSGGLDSSSIVSVVNQLLPKGNLQHVFSARFPGFEKDEGPYIDKVIENCNNAQIIKHEVFPSGLTMLENLQSIMYHQEVPFGSSSIAAQFEVMKLASQNEVKVLLDGQGADEILAGYFTYFDTYLKELTVKNPLNYKKAKIALKKVTRYYPPRKSVIDFYSGYFNESYKRFTDRRRKKIPNNSDYFKGMNIEFVEEFKDTPNPVFKTTKLKKHLKFSLMDRGLNELLRYADRNSMANSIEVRLPFLSFELIEFVFSLPEKYFINNGWTKYLLRKSMENTLPYSIQWRKDKIGYEPPQAKWMENHEIIAAVKDAQQKLINDKILVDKEHSINWQHLMLGMLYD